MSAICKVVSALFSSLNACLISLVQLRKFIQAVRSSPQRRQAWFHSIKLTKPESLESAKDNQLPLMVILDCRTRWCSTHQMLGMLIYFIKITCVITVLQNTLLNLKRLWTISLQITKISVSTRSAVMTGPISSACGIGCFSFEMPVLRCWRLQHQCFQLHTLSFVVFKMSSSLFSDPSEMTYLTISSLDFLKPTANSATTFPNLMPPHIHYGQRVSCIIYSSSSFLTHFNAVLDP